MYDKAVKVCLLLVLLKGMVFGKIVMTDVLNRTGIDYVHCDGSSGQKYLVEYVCAGLALFDYDGDGDIDIYFLSGGALKGTRYSSPPRNRLYRNDANWKFTDVTDEAKVGDAEHSLGVAVADYDNDGDADLYVNNFGPNKLYRNNGDGTFTDVTKFARVENGNKTGAGANFADVDGDGRLDLFVSNYVAFTYDNHVSSTTNGYPVYVGPRMYKPTPDVLYHNNGDGTFTDVSEQAGLSNHHGSGMGTVCADYDNDGDADILVANDMMGNFLLRNDGAGRFEETGLLAGVAYDMNGEEMGSMGIECGDYDNDGLLDFHATSYHLQAVNLYKNLGDGFFEDVAVLSGAAADTVHNVTWGNGFVDLDNDGDRDIFVVVGHLDENVGKIDDRTSYYAANLIFLNKGNGKFDNISSQCGSGMEVALSSRGAGFDDLDNDGDIDVVILNSRREPTILRNDSTAKGHWLQIKLRGTKTNRDAVGARVTVISGDLKQIDEVHSGRGYQSHFGTRLHFGLGDRSRVERIEVKWIGGGRDVYENIAADRIVTLVEGTSSVK